MKRIGYVITVVIALAFLSNLVSSQTIWETTRETITVTGATADIKYNESYLYMPAGGAGSNISGNISLPCNIANLSTMNFIVENNEATAITVNLTVNGVKLLDSYSVASGASVTKSLSDYQTAGGDTSLTYIAWSFNASDTDDEYLNITIGANDANIYSWFSSRYSVVEKTVSTPYIKDKLSNSWFTVTDRINVTNDLNYNLTDVNMTFSYPSHAINQPYSYKNITLIQNNSYAYLDISYQKYGPYIYRIERDGNTVTVKVRSHELLVDVVDWLIDPTDDFYSEYFSRVNLNTLTVEKEGVEIDWTNDNGKIFIEDLTLPEGYTDFTFSWTPSVAPPAPAVTEEEVPFWQQETYGLSNATWLAIIVLIAIGAVIYFEKKK